MKRMNPILVAYPKGTSNACKGIDINRDTGAARVGIQRFQGVSMAAINDDSSWSSATG